MEPKAPKQCEDLAFTKQLFTITRQGHTKPTAEFGAPALIWHVAFWPRRSMDPGDFNMEEYLEQAESDSDYNIYKQLRIHHSQRSVDVNRDFNQFLKDLKAASEPGCRAEAQEIFKYVTPGDWDVPGITPFDALNTEATGFTVWFGDEPQGTLPANGDLVPPTAIRVRVQAETNADFSSVTFIIDAGKPWNQKPVYRAEDIPPGTMGLRRAEIFRHVEKIKEICEPRIHSDVIDRGRLPEELDGGEAAAAELKAAADYLYAKIWDDLCEHFNFNLTNIAGETDEIFANFRGLVISSAGDDEAPENPALTATRVSEPYARFKGQQEGYQSSAIEPNRVVRAYLPFMRRFRAEGDWRDWIACGIFDWRALYITPLGAQSEYRKDEEGRLEDLIPAGHLPDRLKFGKVMRPEKLGECDEYRCAGTDDEREAPTTYDNDRQSAARYLVLHKHEPNRGQIGRMIERINSTGTYRLYALKNWTVIRQASIWSQVYGQLLDAAYQRWINKTKGCNDVYKKAAEQPRKQIKTLIDKLREENQYQKEAKSIISREPPLPVDQMVTRLFELVDDIENVYENVRLKRNDEKLWKNIKKQLRKLRNVKEERDVNLAQHNQNVENLLVDITATLDKLGQAAIGGLPYRVSRSKYYEVLFRNSVDTLRVGNIETWWSYKQFAERGMYPLLDFIANVGARLEKLRERLQRIKDDILQSSISYQTEATRDNTHKLERIQHGISQLNRSLTKDARGTLSSMRWTAFFKRWESIVGITALIATPFLPLALQEFDLHQKTGHYVAYVVGYAIGLTLIVFAAMSLHQGQPHDDL